MRTKRMRAAPAPFLPAPPNRPRDPAPAVETRGGEAVVGSLGSASPLPSLHQDETPFLPGCSQSAGPSAGGGEERKNPVLCSGKRTGAFVSLETGLRKQSPVGVGAAQSPQ